MPHSQFMKRTTTLVARGWRTDILDARAISLLTDTRIRGKETPSGPDCLLSSESVIVYKIPTGELLMKLRRSPRDPRVFQGMCDQMGLYEIHPTRPQSHHGGVVRSGLGLGVESASGRDGRSHPRPLRHSPECHWSFEVFSLPPMFDFPLTWKKS